MDILLMSPYTIRSYTELPTSLLFLKYYVQDHGYKADILDCSAYPEDLDRVVEIIKSKPLPRYFGVTSYTRERFYAYALIKRLKHEFPDVPIIVGGKHFSALPRETLESLPVDIVVIGEGEVTLNHLLTANCYPWMVPGIAFKDAGEIIENPPPVPHRYIDDFRCFDINDTKESSKYKAELNLKGIRKKWISVAPTRGCPYHCTFCSLHQDTRYRSIENVIEEIEQKRELTGVNNVSFSSSSLTIKRSYTEEICGAMIELGVDAWKCYSRVDIDLDLLTRMRESGCVQVEVGLESGSPKVLRRIKKGIDIDQFKQFARHCKAIGINVQVFMMLSLPGETTDDVDMSLQLLKHEIYDCIGSMTIQVCRILPDAPLCREAKDLGIIDPNFNWFQPYEVPRDQKVLCLDGVYHTVPLWIGDMTVDEIRGKQVEFQKIMRQRSTVHTLRQAVAYNLSREGRKHLTSGHVWKDKINKLIGTIYYSIKNMR